MRAEASGGVEIRFSSVCDDSGGIWKLTEGGSKFVGDRQGDSRKIRFAVSGGVILVTYAEPL